MDREWRSLRQEVPWVKRLPSDYVAEKVRLATQPVEDMTGDQWEKVIDLMGSDEILMFATDYPHFDFDSPLRSLPPRLPAALKRKILYDNARDFYGLEQRAGARA